MRRHETDKPIPVASVIDVDTLSVTCRTARTRFVFFPPSATGGLSRSKLCTGTFYWFRLITTLWRGRNRRRQFFFFFGTKCCDGTLAVTATTMFQCGLVGC